MSWVPCSRALVYNGENRMLTLFAYLRAFVCTRHDLGLEILALRQQVAVLKRKCGFRAMKIVVPS